MLEMVLTCTAQHVAQVVQNLMLLPKVLGCHRQVKLCITICMQAQVLFLNAAYQPTTWLRTEMMHVNSSMHVEGDVPLSRGQAIIRTYLMERCTEADKGCHDAPKEAAKGNYMCSVIFVPKHAADRRCCSLHTH